MPEVQREENENIADSEESGLEYESATDNEHDCDTLVHGDESDDNTVDILDTSLLHLLLQVFNTYLYMTLYIPRLPNMPTLTHVMSVSFPHTHHITHHHR